MVKQTFYIRKYAYINNHNIRNIGKEAANSTFHLIMQLELKYSHINI